MIGENGAPPTWLDLYDYRRRMADLYRDRDAAERAGQDAAAVWRHFCAQKDALFAQHPQSPLDPAARRGFTGLPYFPYNPALRFVATLEPATAAEVPAVEASGPHTMTFRRAAVIRFTLDATPLELAVYWIDVYGGSLFLPFRDRTGPDESYGGGRYLFDTAKGSDFQQADGADAGASGAAAAFGYPGGRIILDFNYAYNPSCAYDPRWVCPLAPPENRLPVAIRAGEQRFHE